MSTEVKVIKHGRTPKGEVETYYEIPGFHTLPVGKGLSASAVSLESADMTAFFKKTAKKLKITPDEVRERYLLDTINM